MIGTRRPSTRTRTRWLSGRDCSSQLWTSALSSLRDVSKRAMENAIRSMDRALCKCGDEVMAEVRKGSSKKRHKPNCVLRDLLGTVQITPFQRHAGVFELFHSDLAHISQSKWWYHRNTRTLLDSTPNPRTLRTTSFPHLCHPLPLSSNPQVSCPPHLPPHTTVPSTSPAPPRPPRQHPDLPPPESSGTRRDQACGGKRDRRKQRPGWR